MLILRASLDPTRTQSFSFHEDFSFSRTCNFPTQIRNNAQICSVSDVVVVV